MQFWCFLQIQLCFGPYCVLIWMSHDTCLQPEVGSPGKPFIFYLTEVVATSITVLESITLTSLLVQYIEIHVYHHTKIAYMNVSNLLCNYAKNVDFLNQASDGFLKIVFMWMSVCVCVCLCVYVCPPPRLLITSNTMWHDMDPIWLVKQVLQLLYGNCSWYH